ncbi:MAG TPA: hypothetical protein VGB17_12190 [Pyrinomonadaceae bacterium]
MRKSLLALTCLGLVLFVAGSFAFSHGRTAKTFESLADSVEVGLDPNTPTAGEPDPVSYEPFEVTVLVNGQPLEEYDARGKHYIEAIEGAEYELRIRNPLPVRVAVALSVDGMNTIDARRDTAWNSSKWVIEPYGTIHISGWQMSSERARRFYFTNERDSYGAKLGQTANLGVISAVFFRERQRRPIPLIPRPRQQPMEEDSRIQKDRAPNSASSSARERSGSDSAASSNKAEAYPAPDDEYAATGIGRSVRHDVTWINLDLESRPTAQVTIRYEYREALVRLGIIPRRPYTQPDPLRRRERSTGFEDRRYSPEP